MEIPSKQMKVTKKSKGFNEFSENYIIQISKDIPNGQNL